ncbi:glycoside hydrolase family 5 protein [Schizophyllum commune Tattone D]|nr:glycoside hydrolase family 5 protein [Schizophyllum commune Tattone D]
MKCTLLIASVATAITVAKAIPFLGGVNTAGYDFSVYTDGSFEGPGTDPPSWQYQHFADEGANIFRIPFAWQLMTPNVGSSIDEGFFQRYDATVQSALSASTSPYVILDLHNYARFNNAIVGQGGPANEDLASLWSQIAERYADNEKIIFGIMNEPHDLNSVPDWVDTVQVVVNAIREAGATSQYILIPGSSWSSAAALPTEAGPLLVDVEDPASEDKSLLIFDVHKYLDSDNSGTHDDCVTNNIDTFQALVDFLKQNGNRQALLSESGGGNTDSCKQLFKEQLSFIKENSDTLVGFTAWSAGAFDSTYILTLTPNDDGTDQPLWTEAVVPNLP